MESDADGTDAEVERKRSILLSNIFTDADEMFPLTEAGVWFKLGSIFPSSTSETVSFASVRLLRDSNLGATNISTAEGGDK